MDPLGADLLLGLMALARQQDHVPRPSHGQGLPDGGPPVRLPDPGGEARGKARRHLVQNGFRVLL